MAWMVRSRSSASSRTKSSRRLLERSGPITRTFGGSASGSTSTTTSGWSTGWRMSASETPWRRAERWISTPSQRITEMVPPEGALDFTGARIERSEEHTSELQSLMRISYAVFYLKTKNNTRKNRHNQTQNTDHTHNNI